MKKEDVSFQSLGDRLSASLFQPETVRACPALIVCHGALEFKEDFFEFCEFLAGKGIAAMAVDMHGHGQSQGERYHVEMRQWVADIRAAADFLQGRPGVDGERLGALGLSSGGTAILEAALLEPRLKALVTLDATVRNSLGLLETIVFEALILAGTIKKWFTKTDLRFSALKLVARTRIASDPEVDQKVRTDPRYLEALSSFPLPGAAECFFVDTLKRVGGITAPTLVLWGEEDQLDSPGSARLLFAHLTCRKELHILPGNGHLGHLDRNKQQVFALAAAWALEILN